MPDGPFIFDPRKLIMGPFQTCPRCNADEMGTVSVSNNFQSRRCRNCGLKGGRRLPAVSKRLVYLDQMLLSAIAKELDPVWRDQTKRLDAFWMELFDQLDRLVKLQIIVCPDSPVHEEESAMDDRYEAVLRRLYEHLASGVSLDFPHQVLIRQLSEAFDAMVEDREPDWRRITRDRVVNGALDRWSERLLISVNMGHWEGRLSGLRRSLADGHAKLHELWELWAKEDVPFTERLDRERRGIATAAIESWVRHVDRWRRAETGAYEPADMMELMPGWLVQLVSGLLSRFEELGVPPDDRLRRVAEFLHSEPALLAPQNHIASHLYAGLARRAASGQKRVPSRGTPNDIDFISAYLPYCDAMFVDNEFAQLLAEEPLATAISSYRAQIFSTRSREGFLAYLEELERQAGAEHISLVTDVYGEQSVEPYRSMLEHERGKEAR